LQPTVTHLQDSAQDLMRRMCAVKEGVVSEASSTEATAERLIATPMEQQ
jgi:hypothetical protein